MKYGIMILILTFSWGFGQCDANGDGELDVLDVVIEVDCILTDCWEGEPVCIDCGDLECCDCDGNVYETIQIGEQLWMAENLKVTHYNNGDTISYPSNEDFGSFDEGQYGVYDNDPSNADIYGNLYNWAVVNDDRGICPDGFHVPSDEEFIELEMELSMSEEEANSGGWRGSPVGSKLAGNSYLWTDGDLVNNSEFGTSGFNGLPAGYRNFNNGTYNDMGTTVTFGRLLRAVVSIPGPGDCIIIFQVWAGTTTINCTALVFVAWGISPGYYFRITKQYTIYVLVSEEGSSIIS